MPLPTAQASDDTTGGRASALREKQKCRFHAKAEATLGRGYGVKYNEKCCDLCYFYTRNMS
jgi:hypothetical protein